MSSTPASRRDFFGTAAGGTLLLTAAAAARVPGANDRLRIAVVGCGGMGSGHLGALVRRAAADNVAVPAVCDVYARRRERARRACGGEGYGDYRRVLDRRDVDAVLIATPDHWHGKITIDALAAGKHVYCEKPLTHTVEQAVAVRGAARRARGLVLQVGPNATADDGYWKAGEAIRAGRIGKVTWAQGSYNRNARVCLFNTHQQIDPTADPDTPVYDRSGRPTAVAHGGRAITDILA